MYYRILISRPPALRHHCGKGYQEDDGSCHGYPGPPRDAIGVLDNPIIHKIQHYGHRDDLSTLKTRCLKYGHKAYNN